MFPRKIISRYVRLDRPMGGNVGNIWPSYSNDLIHWGGFRVVMPVRREHWAAGRIGASAPPIEIRNGWLEICHGVKFTAGCPIY